MTIGIYALVFNGTDKVYIGQSVNIEARFKAHISCFKHKRLPYKLNDAFIRYGIPSLEIIEESYIDKLDSLEEMYIREFDSVKNGFNILESSTPIFRGTDNYNSLYSKEQVYRTLDLLIEEPPLLFKKIAQALDVSIAFIQNLSSLNSHTWLKEDRPEKYAKLVQMKGTRISNSRLRNDFPLIIDPLGAEHKIRNALEFSKQYQLNHSHLIGVLNGKRKSHLGWKLKGELS